MNRKWMQLGFCMVALTLGAAAQTNVTNSNNGTSGAVPVYNGAANVTNSPISVSGSNVGIGTTSPSALLDVQGRVAEDDGYDHTELSENGWGGSHTLAFGAYQGGSAAGQSDVTGWFQNSQSAGSYSYGPALMEYVANGGTWNFLIGPASTGAGQNVIWGTPVLSLVRGGHVGIGTTNPGAKLEIDGNVKLTSGSGASITFQDGTVQSTAYTGVLPGGDYADSVDVNGDRAKYGAGDLLVIDPDHPGKFLKSAEPYSTSVAGIFSTKPGTLGRRQTGPKNPDEVPMAMVGIVPTKVSAENGAIRPGDLLVTASLPGYAMKGTDRNRMLGAVVGKALGKLDSGTGVIEVVVTLQ